MIPSLHYDLSNVASQTPPYTAKRFVYTKAALTGDIFEEYDVPAAYPRAKSDPNFTIYPLQPLRSDGIFNRPRCHFELVNAQEGAPDAGKIWAKDRDAKLTGPGWTKPKSELEAFYIEQGDRNARLLCTTDDFLASSNSRTFLNFLRQKLADLWDITIQSSVNQHKAIPSRKRTSTFVPLHQSTSKIFSTSSTCKNKSLSTPRSQRATTCNADSPASPPSPPASIENTNPRSELRDS